MVRQGGDPACGTRSTRTGTATGAGAGRGGDGDRVRTPRLKITLLLHNAYAIGGTIRTTLNLAAALADRHDVEIVSMLRHREVPRFTMDPRVRLMPLVDTRVGSDDMADPRFGEPALDFPAAEKRHDQYSRLVDVRAAEFLRTSDADVLIGTRPGINAYLARFGRRRALRIAQEHLRHDAHSKRLRAELALALPDAGRRGHDHRGGRRRLPRTDAAARRTGAGRAQHRAARRTARPPTAARR